MALRIVRSVGKLCFLQPRYNIQQKVSLANRLKVVNHFHTTAKRDAIPPIVWLVLRPLSKVTAMVFGRVFRKWWQSLPPDKRALFVNGIKKRKYQIGGVCVTVSGVGVHYYFSHIEETPITGRKRFVAFTTQQFMEISRQEFKTNIDQFRTQILNQHDSSYVRVGRVANRLLNANKDIPQIHDKHWTITVVDDDKIMNAYVLPTGNIFVFTGMLQLCRNDDQLGIILGHEMAHAIMSHGSEQISYLHLLDLLVVLPLAFIWAVLPTDILAALAQLVFSQLMQLALHLPFSRELEIEADEVGLQLAAKACFDVREASAFWNHMATLSQVNPELDDIEWLSTHPSHDSRKERLDELMNGAYRIREECQCPSLPHVDPRASVETARKNLEDFVNSPHNFAMPLNVPKPPSIRPTIGKAALESVS